MGSYNSTELYSNQFPILYPPCTIPPMLALGRATIAAHRGGPGFPHHGDGGGGEERGRGERNGKEMQTKIKVSRSRVIRKKRVKGNFSSLIP